jgi:hypothetical protein
VPGDLIYQPKSSEAFSVELKAGTYRYEWFDAEKSAIAGAGRLESSGKEQRFKAPFDGDVVFYLKAE